MNPITQKLLEMVTGVKGAFEGAFSIREDGACAASQSTRNVSITPKKDAPGLVVRVRPGTQGERVYIPACVTHAGVDDLVYNDFLIGENAQVTIVAGCGVHSDGEEEARHNGIHRFFLEKNSHVIYQEKHVGTGNGLGQRSIDPVTEVYLKEGSELEMDSLQLGGVDHTIRKTSGVVGKDAKLIIRERILTDGEQQAKTEFEVEMEGENSSVNLISRSVARGHSYQAYRSRIVGNAACAGHSECDAILAEDGRVDAAPELTANHPEAALIHEAAIGKIAGEQILKLRTLGLTEEEAEAKIIAGFLK